MPVTFLPCGSHGCYLIAARALKRSVSPGPGEVVRFALVRQAGR